MKISGQLIPIKRVLCPCPDDGVHKATRDGFVSSTHAVFLNGVLVPKGSTAFYAHLERKGFKVFYGLDTGKTTKVSLVNEIADAMTVAGRDFCPRAHKVVGCDIDVEYRGGRIRTEAVALEVEHVPWTEAFEQYVAGHAYVWDDLPEHNPEGFKRFVKKARKAIGEQEYKLGNVLYNTRLSRWMLVDVRVG